LEPADQPDGAIEANTATGAWTTVVRLANKVRNREHSNSASGPDYFGFSHPIIAKLIQELPNAERCRHYVMQQFEEVRPKRAPRIRVGDGQYTPRMRKSKNLLKSAITEGELEEVIDEDGGAEEIEVDDASSMTGTEAPMTDPMEDFDEESIDTSRLSSPHHHHSQQHRETDGFDDDDDDDDEILDV
jgi:hypothetical protein